MDDDEAYDEIADEFFIIEVTCLDDDKTYFFRVTFDLRDIARITGMEDPEVIDFVHIHVFVGSLKVLQLCVFHSDYGTFDDFSNDFKTFAKKVNLKLD